MIKDKEIMNTKGVSEFLKLHPFTVNKLAREGRIPAFKIGADWRFHKKHIERWINEKIAHHQQGRERRKDTLTNGSTPLTIGTERSRSANVPPADKATPPMAGR